MIWEGLSSPEVPAEIGMDELFIEALIHVTGEQVYRPGGIDFNEYLNIGQMKLLKENKNGGQWIVGILGFIGHAIVAGTS
jgi:hypothetical protein